MSTKQTLIFIGCLICTLSFGQDQNASQNANLNPRQQALQQAYDSPINFWGKVVDQNGNAIEGAKVTFTIDSHMGEDDGKPKVTVLSDAGGLFSLTNKKGAGIVVYVAKEGYYSTEEQSAAAVNYFLKTTNNLTSFRRGGKSEPFPTEAQPTVFVLTQKGPEAANLGHKRLRVPVPKDGTPVNIDLTQGRVAAAGQGDLQVQSWVTDNGADVVHPFAWKCRVTVLGGGLQVRTGKLAFQAPPGGYQAQDEVDMSATASPWSKDMKKEYFLQLSGNRYVRMRFWMVCGGGNFLNLDYYLNAQPGDHNLESAKSTPY
jgi:hypothetical protein